MKEKNLEKFNKGADIESWSTVKDLKKMDWSVRELYVELKKV